MSLENLPPFLQQIARKHPGVWEAYNQLGAAAAKAGPLDEQQERLVKLAIAIGAGLQGAVHSHVRRGRDAGLTSEQLMHVGILAVTTVGWPSAIAALSWIDEALSPTLS
jgi:alkylhydroperoxidase/carboxymuconolactone decarboxylase family protein YurZ